MNLSQLDIDKIQLIATTTQVNDLISLLVNIPKENLTKAINSVTEEDQRTSMFKFLNHTLEFLEKVELTLAQVAQEAAEVSEQGTEDSNQTTFDFNERPASAD